MALINYALKEITLKIVYYGPGLSGKTTNLQYLHSRIPGDRKGKLLSLATETDRTLFFDFMPVQAGKVGDYTVRFQLYTVPGQVRYNATRKLVLKGADGVVFVADSQKAMREQNKESLLNMRENMIANDIDPDDIPIVLQYNKRDLKTALPVKDLDKDLNLSDYPTVEAVATEGKGIEFSYNLITRLLIKHIARKHHIVFAQPAQAAAPQKPRPRPVSPPPAETPEPIAAKPAEKEEVVTVEPEPAVQAAPPETLEEIKTEEIPEPSEQIQIEEAPEKMAAASLGSALGVPGDVEDELHHGGEIPTYISETVAGSAQEAVAEEASRAPRDTSSTLPSILKELREARKDQQEIIKLLRDIAKALNGKKKS